MRKDDASTIIVKEGTSRYINHFRQTECQDVYAEDVYGLLRGRGFIDVTKILESENGTLTCGRLD